MRTRSVGNTRPGSVSFIDYEKMRKRHKYSNYYIIYISGPLAPERLRDGQRLSSNFIDLYGQSLFSAVCIADKNKPALKSFSVFPCAQFLNKEAFQHFSATIVG